MKALIITGMRVATPTLEFVCNSKKDFSVQHGCKAENCNEVVINIMVASHAVVKSDGGERKHQILSEGIN